MINQWTAGVVDLNKRYRERKNYQRFARIDAPLCIISILPVIYLLNLYRKDEEAWKRDKALLAPTFVVMGIIASIGLYTEIHLASIDYFDMGLTEDSCNLTFNGLLTLGMTPFLFLPIIHLLQLIECFFKMNPFVQQIIAYSWAVLLFGARLAHILFGRVTSSIMCDGGRVFFALFSIEEYFALKGRDLSAFLGCTIIALGIVSAVFQRLKIPLEFISVDFQTIKRTFALTLPTIVLIILNTFVDGENLAKNLNEFNLWVAFSACHFGSISALLIILNYPKTLWKFFTESVLCQRKERIDVSDVKIIL